MKIRAISLIFIVATVMLIASCNKTNNELENTVSVEFSKSPH